MQISLNTNILGNLEVLQDSIASGLLGPGRLVVIQDESKYRDLSYRIGRVITFPTKGVQANSYDYREMTSPLAQMGKGNYVHLEVTTPLELEEADKVSLLDKVAEEEHLPHEMLELAQQEGCVEEFARKFQEIFLAASCSHHTGDITVEQTLLPEGSVFIYQTCFEKPDADSLDEEDWFNQSDHMCDGYLYPHGTRWSVSVKHMEMDPDQEPLRKLTDKERKMIGWRKEGLVFEED